tara:strand:- start:1346 stop:2599 length:1254 start_codon:yes stop_codon:yes gene_type:complete
MSFKKALPLLLFFCLSLIFSSVNTYGEIQYVDTNAKGRGENFEVALKKAFKDAISKINGVSLQSESVLKTIDKSVTTNEKSSATLSRDFQETISEQTKGSIKSFEILNEYKDENGIYIVEIKATVAKFALSQTAKRKRMAIIPFRINVNEISIYGKTFDDADNLRKYLNQEFTSYLVQTRKFTVLDREFESEIQGELANLTNSDKIEDQIKIGQKLFADYIIVGRLDFLVIKEVEKKFLTSDVIKKKNIGVLNFSYRVIDVPTTQIKYSSSVNIEIDLKKETQPLPYLFNLTAKKAGVEIMYAIFPILIEKIENQLAYLGQGGSQLKIGDTYDVYERSEEKIKDTYTGEILGNVEKKVAKATIVDVNSKFSVAEISEEKYDLSVGFKPKKFMVKPSKNEKSSKKKKKKKKKKIDDEW